MSFIFAIVFVSPALSAWSLSSTNDVQVRERNSQLYVINFLIGNMDSDKVSCPICGKDFAVSVIESHASKCLFLNESATDETTAVLKDSSPIARKNKLKPTSAKKNNPVAVKRKNPLEHFSCQNIQRNEEDVKNVLDVASPRSVTVSVLFISKIKQ